MKNLAIIVTGQLRTFFSKSSNDFLKMIKISKEKYKNVFVVCVVNPSHMQEVDKLNQFFIINEIDNKIIDYSLYKNEYEKKCKDKIDDPRIQIRIEQYFSKPKDAHRSINNIKEYSYNHLLVQFHQLQIGIQQLKKYIEESKTEFDIICKTRFDCMYPVEFYPHIFDYNEKKDLMNVIGFNQHNTNIITTSMKEHGLLSLTDLIQFNKETRLSIPYGHLPYQHRGLGLGGMVCYNYESLENIQKNGIDNILYSFNDFFYFAKTSVFLELESLLDECCFIECKNPDLYNHYFCPESQFVMFCLHKKIDIIMYPECLYNSLINR
jgi:hypothetical protein